MGSQGHGRLAREKPCVRDDEQGFRPRLLELAGRFIGRRLPVHEPGDIEDVGRRPVGEAQAVGQQPRRPGADGESPLAGFRVDPRIAGDEYAEGRNSGLFFLDKRHRSSSLVTSILPVPAGFFQ